MSKPGYRRVSEPDIVVDRPRAKSRLRSGMRIGFVVLGVVLLGLSILQLEALARVSPGPASGAAAMAGLHASSAPTSTILGAIFLPLAAALSFIAFAVSRTQAAIR